MEPRCHILSDSGLVQCLWTFLASPCQVRAFICRCHFHLKSCSWPSLVLRFHLDSFSPPITFSVWRDLGGLMKSQSPLQMPSLGSALWTLLSVPHFAMITQSMEQCAQPGLSQGLLLTRMWDHRTSQKRTLHWK